MIKNLIHIDDDADDQELFVECIHAIDPAICCTQLNDSKIVLQNIQTIILPKTDMIFLDLNMACVDGMKLLEALRQVENYSSIPVTIFTTSSAKIDIEKSKILGATYFATKPNSFREWEENLKLIVGLQWTRL
jgi:CheY-like chemotaxis protein